MPVHLSVPLQGADGAGGCRGSVCPVYKGLPGFFKDILFPSPLSPTVFSEKCKALSNLHRFIFCCIF